MYCQCPHKRYDNFNPRSSCEERRPLDRRACKLDKDFNPRSSCEERLVEAAMMRDASMISIHAPHARSDACQPGKDYSQVGFQSTLLMRGATADEEVKLVVPVISIHAPHARSDEPALTQKSTTLYFNPRSSCEERLASQ